MVSTRSKGVHPLPAPPPKAAAEPKPEHNAPHVVVLEAWATAVRSRDMFEVRAALEWADEVTVNTLIHVPGPEVGQSESPMTALTHMVVREGLLLLLLVLLLGCATAAPAMFARPPACYLLLHHYCRHYCLLLLTKLTHPFSY